MEKNFYSFMTAAASVIIAVSALLGGCAGYAETENVSDDSLSVPELVVYTEPETDQIYEPDEETDREISPETEDTEILSEDDEQQETETESGDIEEEETEETPEDEEIWADYDDENYVEYSFRSKKLLNQHFEKHGDEFAGDFGYETAQEYEKGASDVINNPEALYKTEAEDGDGVYYIEATNEFVILSTDGYIRTYFRPNAGIDYFNRQ